MPTLNLVVNVKVEDAKALALELSKLGATLLNKPERYISVFITYNETLAFAGTFDPAYSLRIDCLDRVNPELNEGYSRDFAKFLENRLGIRKDRGYITIIDPGRAHIGYDGTTFATIFGRPSE